MAIMTQAPYDAELLQGDRWAPHPPLQLRKQTELVEPTTAIPLAAANVTMLRALQEGQCSRRGQATRLRWRLRSSRHPSAVPNGSLATAAWLSSFPTAKTPPPALTVLTRPSCCARSCCATNLTYSCFSSTSTCHKQPNHLEHLEKWWPRFE